MIFFKLTDEYNSLCFKLIDKANCKFDFKIKEALHINWRKPNLNAQQNHLALTLLLFPLFLFCLCCLCVLFCFVFLFCISLSSIILMISDTNYRYLLLLLLSSLHFAITSSHYNKPCIASFSLIHCFHYLYANYRNRNLLLS